MCGITGYVGEREAAPILIDGLARLEYRGYDSVGIAVLDAEGGLSITKKAGKIARLRTELGTNTPPGCQGIGHTRWATHGRPTDENAHPHTDCSGNVVVIHNGIVENHQELRVRLASSGHKFSSDTDTEVIPHLIEDHLKDGKSIEQALTATIDEIDGAHAILAMTTKEPGVIVAARVGNAGGIVIGYGNGETFLASDLPALLPYTRRVVFLENGDFARVTATGVTYTRNRVADRTRAPGGAIRPGIGGQGLLQALHAEGDRRAAGGDPRHGARTGAVRRVAG